MHFLDINVVILKNQKYLLKCVCIYRKNNPNGELEVEVEVEVGRGYPEL